MVSLFAAVFGSGLLMLILDLGMLGAPGRLLSVLIKSILLTALVVALLVAREGGFGSLPEPLPAPPAPETRPVPLPQSAPAPMPPAPAAGV
ncbi:hypothetical protein LNKW23_12850 [Paralimibaculum aggregatum]|uniref:Uncharacterized protein n=1 Tax=Paralimibaculum aggregatum TaxID=3036245 RepID=A0ABQ6LK69_9RHOB|nr:hypothetical protein [Limibaculum sp. NKW23]GMG82072.1 hypothetical protein LNKW23_12850 [Limibaculum sp. NKW23]